jgi:hypothetical protein
LFKQVTHVNNAVNSGTAVQVNDIVNYTIKFEHNKRDINGLAFSDLVGPG